MKDDRFYLIHIRECIARVGQYTAAGHEAFVGSTLIQDAVIRNLQILAESSQRLSEALRTAHPDVDWSGITGFRNVLVHGYLNVDAERVWIIVEQDLPVLKAKIDWMLQTSQNSP
jgi:uncharacterized protein with HEPN domain